MVNNKHIFFLGIGGIGMSALARYFKSCGEEISGYDKTETELTRNLVNEGIHIIYRDDVSALTDGIDMVIYTPAIPQSLSLYLDLKSRPIPFLKRSEVLGSLSRNQKNIAIAGTHGKTTTSLLVAHILYDTGVPLTALLGGIASNYNNNFLQTGEDWFVLEADEYDRSFLHLTPDIAAIGSLDADHLDIYGDRTSMVRSYLQFASQVKEEGVLLLSDTIAVEDIISAKQSVSSNVRVEIFGLNNFENSCVVVEHSEGKVRFHYTENSQVVIPNLQMRLPGEHNIRNAIAAIRISRILKIAPEKISKALANFSGIYRRFEILLRSSNAVLIDDYAHHPEELKSAIHTCKLAYKGRKVTGIFQPHLYSRTKDFLNEFAEVLDGLDQILLVELYPDRELPIEGISSQSIYDKLKNKKKYLTTKKELLELLKTLETDVVLMMGAGDLDVMREQIKKAIEEKQ